MTGVIHRMLAHKRLSEQEAQSRADFLATAKGDTGPAGEQGPQGERGPAGRDGKDGKPGKDGKDGRIVVLSRGGSSGTDLSTLIPGNSTTEPSGIAVVQAGQWVNLPWEAFIQTIAGAVDMGVELSRRSDFVGENIIYRGEAAPGAAESAAVWRIKRIEFVVGVDGKSDITEKWAGGNAEFVNSWADRTTLEYL